jgi:hypothetical protein
MTLTPTAKVAALQHVRLRACAPDSCSPAPQGTFIGATPPRAGRLNPGTRGRVAAMLAEEA